MRRRAGEVAETIEGHKKANQPGQSVKPENNAADTSREGRGGRTVHRWVTFPRYQSLVAYTLNRI